MTSRYLTISAALSLALLNVPAFAQLPDSEAANAAPAASTATAKPSSGSAPAAADGDAGTTIIGDQESPIGLYITPWKNDFAERSLDRPARYVDDQLVPIDPDTFRRQIQYYDTINEYRKKHIAAGN